MKKLSIIFSIFFLPALLLIGCSNQSNKFEDVEMQQLTRVDVQVVKPDESYDLEVIFAHKEDIEFVTKDI